MKTFTNYAEKKAKQILNLLQGYTKGIRITAILILLLMGVSNAWANKYWYAGGKNSWGNTTMTVSADNYYEYCDGTYNGVHQFKIKVSSNSWDNALDYNYTNWGFNNTNITNGNSSTNPWGENHDNTNICIYNGNNNKYYIIVYYPNTAINTTNKPIICASTTLPKSWTVVYNGNGNTGGSVPTDNAIYSNNATVTVKGNTGNLTKNGYTFSGWNTKADGSGTTRNANTTFSITAHTTLYAKWTATEKTHTVTISYKYGNTNISSGTTQSVGEVNATSITAPTIPGYTFEKWTLGTGIVNKSGNTTANPISITTNSTGSYTLTANYTKNSYTLNFGVQGNIGGSATATVGGSAINSPETFEHGTEITLTATADDKYAFIQWVDGSGASLSTANPYTHTLTANTTIQAVFANTDVLYLKPIDDWKQNNEWYAAYFYKEGTGDNFWVRMKNEDPCGGSAYYKTLIPDGDWTHVIFIRMDGSKTDLKWENKWDQTVDLTIPTDGKNCFTNGSKNNEKFTGSWSTHTPTNYEPVVFNVTVPAGTPNCYIIGDWDGWSQFTEMTKVDNTHYTVTIPDVCATSAKYKYCYGPSWGCQEVANISLPTTTITDRTHTSQDVVEAWIKYCLVGQDIGWNWNNDYSFDVAGNMSHDFNAKNHNIKVMSSTNTCYTHNEYTYNLHRSHTSVKIPHEGGYNNDLILQADLAGTYKFHFDPVSKLLTIEFPEKGYRLKITMADGNVYTSNAVDNAEETLSFFAPGTEDTELKGTITLEHEGQAIAEFTPPTITESGVYTAKLNSDKKSITTPVAYSGNYYIRTDGANGGWSNYKTDSDNKMTYFVPREEEKYSYYWVQALPRAPRDHTNGVVNVKACVANDYNDNLAIMLEADKFTSDAYGNVNIIDPDELHREKINVRFGYNPKTNHFERAMLTGSGNINSFLNITDPDKKIYKTYKDGQFDTPLTAPDKDSKFTDISNWVYERDVWVDVQETEDVTVRLTAVSYNGARNSLFGFNDAEQKDPTQRTIVAKNSTPGPKKMRVIYDFKTNRMIMAWMPGENTLESDINLNANILFIRHENDVVPQLNTNGKQIRGIQNQYFSMEFDKNESATLQEEHYWFSLPFDCVVGSITGVHGYMDIWGIQRYNGKKRAEIGWFINKTETFWEWMTPNDTLKAGEGYVLSFAKQDATWNTFDIHHDDGTIEPVSLLRLYFPAIESGFDFHTASDLVVTYPNQPCKIASEDRYKQDGNWKIIGSTSYNNTIAEANITTTEDSVWQPEGWSVPKFRYSYTYDNSSTHNRKTKCKYIPENGKTATYNSFYGYMVQFAGTIKWSSFTQATIPSSVAARKNSSAEPTSYTTCLELVDNTGYEHDRTFVALDEEATIYNDLNKDLCKVFNSYCAQLYTTADNVNYAGNTLPMEKQTVPVGIVVAEAGEYTFRMPDGTDGISVTLVDNVTGTHTDMLMDEYTITLDAGTIENRFYLVVDPDRAATSVENIGEGAKGEEAKDQIKKFLIDGKLFIRTADGIFDAKGQRL